MKNRITEKKEMLYGTILSYANLFISILISVFFTNFIVSKLGVNEYGLRSFSLSFVSYLSFFELGISTAYLRIAYQKRNERGEEGVKHVNGIFLKIYLILGILSLIVGTILVILIQTDILVFSEWQAVFPEAKNIISMIIAISFMNAAVSFPCSVFSLIVTASKKFIWRNLRILLITIFNFAVELILLVFGYKSVAITLGCFVVEVVFCFINFIYIFYILKARFTLNKSKNDKKVLKEIIGFSIFSFLATITQTLNLSVDKILLGFIAPLSVTIYTLSVAFNGYVATCYSSISAVFAPKITECALADDKILIQKDHDLIMNITAFIVTFIVFGFVSCGSPFIQFWLRNSNELTQIELNSIYIYACVLLLCNVFTFPQATWVNIHRAYDKHKITALIYVIAFVVNIGLSISLSIWLSKYNLAILGCVIGTVISCIIQTVFMSIYTSREFGIRLKNTGISLAKNSLFGLIAFGIIMIITLIPAYSSLLHIYRVFIQGFSFVIVFMLLEIIFNRNVLKLIFYSITKRRSK